MLQQLIVSILAVVLSYIFFRWYKNKQRCRQHLLKIEELRTEFDFKKTVLKEQLGVNFARWQEIARLPFRELQNGLQSGKILPSDALKAYQFMAVQCSDKTNAITGFLPDCEALSKSLDTESEKKPLHGIPVSVKECFIIKGTEATAGHASYLGRFIDHQTAAIIEFLKDLGCVPFVKTNIPQGMLTYDSRNAIYGSTGNPHDITRSPGGSSSGEGAMVGGGGSILGVGSDIGGSLRIPSAFCGCVTIKPTSNRMFPGGSCPGVIYPRVSVADFLSSGFLTRDVETLVTVYRLLYSNQTFDKFAINSITPVPFREDLFHSDKKLKIAYWDYDGITETVPAVKRAVQIAKSALEANGHELVAWKPVDAKVAFLLICETLAIDGSVAILRALDEDIEIAYANRLTMATMKIPYFLKYILSFVTQATMGEFPSQVLRSLRPARHPDDLNDVFRRVRDFRHKFAAAFTAASFDAILCPAFACPALPLNAPRDALGAATYTCFFNALNWPAGVLPVTRVSPADEEAMASYPGDRDLYHKTIKAGLSSDSIGLPVAVQLAAPQYREEVVLRLMGEVEKAVKYDMKIIKSAK